MLNVSQVGQIMKRLGVAHGPISPSHLEDLIAAYVRSVPWESASRIVKRLRCRAAESCARWPNEFWHDNLELGTGGTCFESNYAFMALLSALGYRGYLTVNDMGTTQGCHAALVLRLDGASWLIDVGIPVHVPIRLDAMYPTAAPSAFHNYVVTPIQAGIFDVTRDRHPKPYIYTLLNKPIDDVAFRGTLVRDYDPTAGLFLDCIIINKVIDNVQYRFCSSERPWRIASFADGRRQETFLGEEVVRRVAAHFEMDRGMLLEAWSRVVDPTGSP